MKTKTVFYCTGCGNETAKWSGRCLACGEWNTLEETQVTVSALKAPSREANVVSVPRKLSEIIYQTEERFSTGLGELDRVLGGGAVRGSLVLLGGAPGIGKSTLLLQICAYISDSEKILYISGEESLNQLMMRSRRLEVPGESLSAMAEVDIDEIIAAAERFNPGFLIIDSIQTMRCGDISSSAGSVSQIRECTARLMQYAKSSGCMVFIVGHVTKEGSIAGPKILEHMVDCVLYFGGESNLSYRILRAAKNRFGSTNEIGVFEMHDTGLSEVANPSEALLSGRPKDSPGTCVTCVVEGSRPILAEIQALAAPTVFNAPRRNMNGIDYNRATLLLAVLEKRAGLKISSCDTYINVIGGLEVSEPAADLAVVLSAASSFSDHPIGFDVAAIGEIGLSGEVRAVSCAGMRLREIARLGFTKCLIPRTNYTSADCPKGLELIPVSSVKEAIAAAFGI